MGLRFEQKSKGEFLPGYKRYLKWAARRKRRRQEKTLMEEAPRRNRYAGWSL